LLGVQPLIAIRQHGGVLNVSENVCNWAKADRLLFCLYANFRPAFCEQQLRSGVAYEADPTPTPDWFPTNKHADRKDK
jgi:hypothetical protein